MTGFRFAWNSQWKPLDEMIVGASADFMELRPLQEEGFHALKDSVAHWVIEAPMGIGKSILIRFLCAQRMMLNPKLRSVIAVPQTIIGAGFTDTSYKGVRLPDGNEIGWSPRYNLCDPHDSLDETKINALIAFLEGSQRRFNDRILVCSHATLVAAYARVSNDPNRLDRCFRNLLLWIDEAHHLQNAEIEGYDERILSNRIGEAVRYLSEKETVLIGLATATLFRGDQLSIFGDVEDRFERFSVPYDLYFKHLRWLTSFSYDFAVSSDVCVSVHKILHQRQGKDIIFLPPRRSTLAAEKYGEVQDIIIEYQKIHGGRVIDDPHTGLTILRRQGKPDFKIMNLVDEYLRDEKKKYINSIKSRNDLDVIIALNMFKEGANWIWCDRVVVLGARKSLNDVVQMMGRAFRDANGKDHVNVIQVLPFNLGSLDESEFRNELNDYLKFIYGLLLLEDLLNPVKVALPGEPRNPREPTPNWLGDDAPSILSEVQAKLIDIWIDQGEEDVSKLWDEYSRIIPKILESYGVPSSYHEAEARRIWGIMARATLEMRDVDVSDIDFQILQETNPLGFLLDYTSGACGIETFDKLREAINKGRSFVTFEEARVVAQAAGILTKEQYHTWDARPSTLPYQPNRTYRDSWVSWPDFLATDRKVPKSVEMHVVEAERLAAEYGGILPAVKWLEKNGYGALTSMMRKNPDSFSHIAQAKNRKTIKEHVASAERLAADHGGQLPSMTWLQQNGYGGLSIAIYKSPDSFSHIDQKEGKRMTIDYHVAEAERLTQENGGKLPNVKWLRNNGYTNIGVCMRKNPDRFAHLEQKRLKVSAEEHVKVAEALAREHGGILPNPYWLEQNGFLALGVAIRNNPYLFTHIPQRRNYKSVEDHLVDAAKLMQEHGKIPDWLWLRDNGYAPLYQAIGRYPDKFKSFK